MTAAFAEPDSRHGGAVPSPLEGGGDGAAFEFALEAAGIGVFDYDVTSGRQRLSARCRALWGLADDVAPTPAALEGRMHPDDRHLLEAVWASLRPAGPGSFDVQHRIVLPDGRGGLAAAHEFRPTSRCSTSACLTSAATSSPAAFAASPGVRMFAWSRSPAGARTRTVAARAMPVSTST